jgi:hypothetical protein
LDVVPNLDGVTATNTSLEIVIDYCTGLDGLFVIYRTGPIDVRLESAGHLDRMMDGTKITALTVLALVIIFDTYGVFLEVAIRLSPF